MSCYIIGVYKLRLWCAAGSVWKKRKIKKKKKKEGKNQHSDCCWIHRPDQCGFFCGWIDGQMQKVNLPQPAWRLSASIQQPLTFSTATRATVRPPVQPTHRNGEFLESRVCLEPIHGLNGRFMNFPQTCFLGNVSSSFTVTARGAPPLIAGDVPDLRRRIAAAWLMRRMSSG